MDNQNEPIIMGHELPGISDKDAGVLIALFLRLVKGLQILKADSGEFTLRHYSRIQNTTLSAMTLSITKIDIEENRHIGVEWVGLLANTVEGEDANEDFGYLSALIEHSAKKTGC